MTDVERNLVNLYKTWSGIEPGSITKLPGSGSYRSYYRLLGAQGTVIGAHNSDARENEAFITFTNHFQREGIPVPKVLANDRGNCMYLLTDLGDTTLYQLLTRKRVEYQGDPACRLPPEVMDVYKKAIRWLPVIQVKAGKTMDYTVCYPRAAFDRQSMMWDLNYFKYYFLKLAKVPFDEQALENDFTTLCDLLQEADSDFFLFRDFQSRNIMVFSGEPWFIDYQGGRKGALQYDIASLLMDGKADIPEPVREELLLLYLDELEKVYPVDRKKFLHAYDGFVLIRILQALGAYGFRGYYENKAHFLLSIPFALRNLRYLRANKLIDFGLNSLMQVIDMMVDNPIFYNQQNVEIRNHIDDDNNILSKKKYSEHSARKLTVTINSFSYKKAIPADGSGNGGGFVFDCRALPNPGRYDEFKQFNGTDQPVIDFLKKETAVREFVNFTCSLVDQSVSTYIDREFDHLLVSFGCTGGQHRSVYCAEILSNYLKSKYNININLHHIEQELKK